MTRTDSAIPIRRPSIHGLTPVARLINLALRNMPLVPSCAAIPSRGSSSTTMSSWATAGCG